MVFTLTNGVARRLAREVISLGSCKACFIPPFLSPLMMLLGIVLCQFGSPLSVRSVVCRILVSSL